MHLVHGLQSHSLEMRLSIGTSVGVLLVVCMLVAVIDELQRHWLEGFGQLPAHGIMKIGIQ